MEKQSLIKYYCVLFVVLVLLASAKNAIAQSSNSSPTVQPTIVSSPATTQSRENVIAPSNNSTLPLIISILALAVSGSAIALSILKNKELNRSIDSLNKKYSDQIRLLENKYTGLLNSQKDFSANKPQETINRNSANSNDNAYLEATIERHSERISKLENRLQVSQAQQQFIDYSKKSSYNQALNVEPSFNPFQQNDSLPQPEINQPLENLAYIELVNIYNANPKLL